MYGHNATSRIFYPGLGSLDGGRQELSREGAAESYQDGFRTQEQYLLGEAERVEPAYTVRKETPAGHGQWSWYTRYSTRKVGWITLPGSRKLIMDRELRETQQTPKTSK
jgi:hypothetical protein